MKMVADKLNTANGGSMTEERGSFAANVKLGFGEATLGLFELVLVKDLSSVDVIIGIDILGLLSATPRSCTPAPPGNGLLSTSRWNTSRHVAPW